jgi:CBS domain containing-hemolysin-like protein
LNGAGALVLKLFGYNAPAGHQLVHSEEEIKMILAQSAAGGALERQEVEMMHKILQLGDVPVRNIMMPRTEIKAIDADILIKEFKKIARNDNLSRYPVYKSSIDTILGYIHEKDINKLRLDTTAMTILQSGLIREIINVPEVQRIDDVLQAMRKRRVHMAIVNDEYGGTLGIVTLEDILESIVGEIYDEFDKTEKTIRKQTDGKYHVDGLTPVQTIQQRFNIRIKGQGYVTIGGVVFGLLGREPKLGDTIQIADLEIKVNEIEKKRIKSLILTRLKIKK